MIRPEFLAGVVIAVAYCVAAGPSAVKQDLTAEFVIHSNLDTETAGEHHGTSELQMARALQHETGTSVSLIIPSSYRRKSSATRQRRFDCVPSSRNRNGRQCRTARSNLARWSKHSARVLPGYRLKTRRDLLIPLHGNTLQDSAAHDGLLSEPRDANVTFVVCSIPEGLPRAVQVALD
jgi:hypothetical protein